MKQINISNKQARLLTLQAQGLLGKPFESQKQGTLQAIEHIGYVQIDTISVVERAHHHVIWSRVPTYKPQYLDELVDERNIFEYWSHAAAYLPIRDYRYSLVRKQHFAGGSTDWFGSEPKVKKYVLDRINAEGALSSADFEHTKKSNGWWSWKPAKRALEHLFMEGTLMVSHRRGFQKMYDIPERVLPPGIDTTLPTKQEFAEHLIYSSINAHGFATAEEISYLLQKIKPEVKKSIQQLEESGALIALAIQDNKQQYYTTPESLERLQTIKSSKSISLLNPFDNVVIQRKRLAAIFNYSYQIECYVPAPKRVYGYYCLPILFGSEFIGRLDAKAVRATGEFVIHNLYIEHQPRSDYLPALATSIKKYATFNGCDTITITATSPTSIKKKLIALLR
ncbi:MAG: YcaQ family DNA glycosylase [Candidatus Kapabacteria bacterium]|nr:YcaQ family DNA glycosylase [Candidatus Kapabacteria bacterium]